MAYRTHSEQWAEERARVASRPSRQSSVDIREIIVRWGGMLVVGPILLFALFVLKGGLG